MGTYLIFLATNRWHPSLPLETQKSKIAAHVFCFFTIGFNADSLYTTIHFHPSPPTHDVGDNRDGPAHSHAKCNTTFPILVP